MTRPFTRCWLWLALCGLAVSTIGCVPKELTEKIHTVRQTKYAADDAFVGVCGTLLKQYAEGWKQKHELQRLIINNNFLAGVQNNGAKFNEKGDAVDGTISAKWIWDAIKVRDKQLADLSISERKVEENERKVKAAMDQYAAANQATYANEEEAHQALMSYRAALLTAIEATGAFAGGFASGFLAGGG